MSNKIIFEVITKAQLGELKNLANTLDEITKSAKGFNRIKGMEELEKGLKNIGEVAQRTKSIVSKDMLEAIGDQSKKSANDVEGLVSQLRDLSNAQGRLDKDRRRAKQIPEELAEAENRLVEAKERVLQAQRRINAMQQRGGGTAAEMKAAKADVAAASKAFEDASGDVNKLGREMKKISQGAADTDRAYTKLTNTLYALRNADGGKKLIKDAFTKGDAALIQNVGQSLKSFQAVAGKALDPSLKDFNRISSVIDGVQGDVRGLTNEYQRLEIQTKLAGQAARLAANQDAEAARVRARAQAAQVKANQQAATQLARQQQQQAAAQVKAAQQAAATQVKAQAAQQKQATQTQQGNTALVWQQAAQAAKQSAAQQVAAAKQVQVAQQQAVQQQQAAIRQQAALQASAAKAAGQAGTQAIAGQAQNRAAIMSSVAALKNLINAYGTGLVGAIRAASTASKSFLSSGANMFSGIQRALQSTSNMFSNFAKNVTRSMQDSRSAMMEFYAAGFALNMMGSQIQQFGMSGFRNMSNVLNDYMEYEKVRNQAAIAGADNSGVGGAYSVPTQLVDTMIRNLQRGTATPEWLQSDGQGRLPVAFDSKELAQGLYFFSSAIGQEITSQNSKQISDTVSTIMQMARVTNTSVETATKGVLNTAMQFGYSPRDLSSSDQKTRETAAYDLSNIAAQMGYLANISTMEVSDIVQMFKMVGPMAHILSGSQKGAGLSDTFLMAFMASEMGLRGGNVGRGVNQALTTMLHPTAAALEEFGKFFPSITDQASFKEFFFDDNGTLKGGFTGLLRTISETVPANQQAAALAALYTTNATRALIGPVTSWDEDTITDFLADIESNSPMDWMQASARATADSVNGAFMMMTNGWFQFKSAVIQSIQGPLMAAFSTLGEFLFEFADVMQLNPAIGQGIAAIITAISGISAVVGTLMIGAGAVLLLGRSFAVAGGMVLPFLRILAMAGISLLALLPMLALIGVAAGVAAALFQSNFLGIKDALGGAKDWFSDFEGNVVPAIENVFEVLARAGAAFREFVDIIVMGESGPANNLFAGLQAVFGKTLGGAFIGGLGQLRNELQPTRDELNLFFSDKTFQVSDLQYAGDAVRGFFEQLILGRTSMLGEVAQYNLGNALGIESLPAKMVVAANATRQFLGELANFVGQVITTWKRLGSEIFGNLERVFQAANFGSVFEGIGALLQGVAYGILRAITLILTGVSMVTDKIADFAEGFAKAEASGKTFMGMTISLRNILTALGAAIGLYFGARLVMMFSPMLAIVARILPMFISLGAAVLGVGVRFVLFAAQVAISTAAILAQVAVWATYTTAMALWNAVGLVYNMISMTMAATMGAKAAATTTAGAAVIGYAVSLMAANTALGLFLFGLLSVIAVLVGIAAIAFGAALAFTAIGAAMLIAVGVTQGWGAAWAGLQQMLAGVWAGLQGGIAIISAVVSAMVSLGTALGNAFAGGNQFYGIGLLIGGSLTIVVGALTAATAAAALFGVVSAGAWLMSLGPIGILITAILGIGLAIAGAMALMMVHMDSIGLEFDSLADTVNVAGVAVGIALMEGIAEGALAGMKNLATTNDGVMGFVVNAMQAGNVLPPDVLLNAIGINGGTDTNLDWTSNYLERVKTEQQVEGVWDYQIPVNAQVEEKSFMTSLLGSLEGTKMGDMFNSVIESVGLDPENLDLSALDFSDLFESTGFESFLDEFDAGNSEFTDVLADYQQNMDDWSQYQEILKQNKGNKQAADALWAQTGRPVPVSPDDYAMNVFGAMEEDAAAAADGVEANMQRIRDAVASLSGMSAADFLGATLDPLAGQGNKSLASWFAGEGAQPILDALGDNAPWMNQMELMADVAGTGLDLSKGVYGTNMHETLAPYLEILSRQSGVSIGELLADIPKFFAPEEFMGIGAADLMMGISKNIPPVDFEIIDTLGMDIFDSLGNPMEEAGLEWAELQAYAVGNAVSGVDWNLADYISESWGISISEANAYLASHGIDPDAINSTWFEATEAAALTGNGEYLAMTEGMYNTIAGYTNNFTDDVISMTRSEWERIPPAYRAVMASLGITTIIEEVIPPEAKAAAEANIRDFVDMVAGLPTYIAEGMEGMANWTMDGDPSTWMKVGEFRDATGQVISVLQDLDGTQVHVPAAQVDDYMYSMERLRGITEGAIAHLKSASTYMRMAMDPTRSAQDRTGDYSSGLTQLNEAANDQARNGGGYSSLSETLGLPDPSEGIAYGESVATNVNTGFTGAVDLTGFEAEVQSSLQSAVTTGISGINFGDISAQFANQGRLAGMAFKNALTSAMAGPAVMPTGMAGGQAAVPIAAGARDAGRGGGMGVAAGAAQQVMKIKVELDTASVDMQLTTLQGKISALAGPAEGSAVKILVSADTTAAAAAIEGVLIKLRGMSVGSFPVKVTADVLPAENAVDGLNTKLGFLVDKIWVVNVGHQTSAALAAIESVLMKLRGLTAGSWNATVGVVDNASGTLQGVINLLNSISGRNAVATVTTVNRTVNEVVSSNLPGFYAEGGRVNTPFQIVGEDGPELVQLPMGSFVHTASETQSMLARSMSSPTNSNAFAESRGDKNNQTSSNIEHATMTSNVVNIENVYLTTPEASRAFLDQVDRYTGKKNNAAQRGMTSFDNADKLW